MKQSAITERPRGRFSITKDPDATIDCSFNWEEWLEDANTTILTVALTTEGVAAYVALPYDNGIVTVLVSEGTVGEGAFVTCRITTLDGRIDERTLHFFIREK